MMSIGTLALLLSTSAGAIEVGETAPVLKPSGADLDGKVILVNIWASWCGPCRRELPVLEDLNERLGDRDDALVVALNIDTHFGPARSLIRHLDLSLPMVYDMSGETAAKFAPAALPASYLVNGEGVVVEVLDGAIDQAEAEVIEKRMRGMVEGGS